MVWYKVLYEAKTNFLNLAFLLLSAGVSSTKWSVIFVEKLSKISVLMWIYPKSAVYTHIILVLHCVLLILLITLPNWKYIKLLSMETSFYHLLHQISKCCFKQFAVDPHVLKCKISAYTLSENDCFLIISLDFLLWMKISRNRKTLALTKEKKSTVFECFYSTNGILWIISWPWELCRLWNQ